MGEFGAGQPVATYPEGLFLTLEQENASLRGVIKELKQPPTALELPKEEQSGAN